MANFFISVDWGTSNLRIKLVETPSLEVVDQMEFSEGIKHVFEAWKERGGDREDFFLAFLKEKIQLFNNPIQDTYSVVISGMASSSIGLRELPYAELPFGMDGNGIYFEQIERKDILPNLIYLISGIKGPNEVMRGEEVQILGLVDKTDSNSLFILPGTHSKHVLCSGGLAIDFRSYMTGEIFQVMTTHSILSGSVEGGGQQEMYMGAFDEGVLKSAEEGSLLNKLFSVRTNSLFNSKSKGENYFYLSGLLIGDELKDLLRVPEFRIRLCADGRLSKLYERGIEQLELSDRTDVITAQEVGNSVVKGQWKLINNHQW